MIRNTLLLFATALPLAAELPQDAVDLKAKRDAKIAEIDRTYAAELAKVLTRTMDAGNLAGANEIQKEIDRVTKESFKGGNPTTSALVGTWKYITKGSNPKTLRREFTTTHLIDHTGEKHPYEIKGSTIFIDFGRGWEKATLDSSNPNVMKGANHRGMEFTYQRL